MADGLFLSHRIRSVAPQQSPQQSTAHSEKRVSEGRRVRIGLSLGCDRETGFALWKGKKKPGVGELSLWDGH